jgi:hypothetical protein
MIMKTIMIMIIIVIVQTGSGVHPTSYPMEYRGLFLRG